MNLIDFIEFSHSKYFWCYIDSFLFFDSCFNSDNKLLISKYCDYEVYHVEYIKGIPQIYLTCSLHLNCT